MPNRTAARLLVAAVWLAMCLSPSAQPVFSGDEVFPLEEFAARRARVAERIGDGVAILLGTTERPGEQPFRQNNQFFYLTGVAQPRAIVAIDGKSKKTTLFLLPHDERREQRMFGPALGPELVPLDCDESASTPPTPRIKSNGTRGAIFRFLSNSHAGRHAARSRHPRP